MDYYTSQKCLNHQTARPLARETLRFETLNASNKTSCQKININGVANRIPSFSPLSVPNLTVVPLNKRILAIEFIEKEGETGLLVSTENDSGPNLFLLSSSDTTKWCVRGLAYQYNLFEMKVDPQENCHEHIFEQCVGALADNGSFIYLRLKNESDEFFISFEHHIHIAHVKFSSLHFPKCSASPSKTVFLGSRDGKIYQYCYGAESPLLSCVYDYSFNFLVTSLCSVQEASGDIALLGASFGDGHIKFYTVGQPSPTTELNFQNKAIRSLFWDANINLLYYLNEAEENDLLGLVIYREKRNERVKRLVRAHCPIIAFEVCLEANFFALVCEDATVQTGLVSDLRAAVLFSKKAAIKPGRCLRLESVELRLSVQFWHQASFYTDGATPRRGGKLNASGLKLERADHNLRVTACKCFQSGNERDKNGLAVGTENGTLIVCLTKM